MRLLMVSILACLLLCGCPVMIAVVGGIMYGRMQTEQADVYLDFRADADRVTTAAHNAWAQQFPKSALADSSEREFTQNGVHVHITELENNGSRISVRPSEVVDENKKNEKKENEKKENEKSGDVDSKSADLVDRDAQISFLLLIAKELEEHVTIAHSVSTPLQKTWDAVKLVAEEEDFLKDAVIEINEKEGRSSMSNHGIILIIRETNASCTLTFSSTEIQATPELSRARAFFKRLDTVLAESN